MTLNVEAVYQDGQLKFKQPLALAEGTAVRVTITPLDEGDEDPLAAVIGICNTGRTDGAENHDKYIYGREFAKRRAARTPKKKKTPATGRQGSKK